MKHCNLTDGQKFDFIVILSVAMLYSLNNLIFKDASGGGARAFFVSHFNDLICPFGFFSACNFLVGFLGRRLTKLMEILPIILAAGFVWEFVTPFVKDTSVADAVDFYCYVIGALLYWLMLERLKVD